MPSNFKLDIRESFLPRIATGTFLITLGGAYTGQVIYSNYIQDPYLAEEIFRLRQVRLNWIKYAFKAGFVFFSLVELTHLYFKHAHFYRSYFTDSTIAGLLTYPLMLKYL